MKKNAAHRTLCWVDFRYLCEKMLEKLQQLEDEYNDIQTQMADPEVIADQKTYQVLVRKFKQLKPTVELYSELKQVNAEIEEAEMILKESSDEDMKSLAKEQLDAAREKQPVLEEKLKFELLPKDPEDMNNAIIEIRAGAGGVEASIFAEELSRMYMRYLEKIGGYAIEIISTSYAEQGIKEMSFKVDGDSAYGLMKYESGVHRVQRIPVTESQGRIHTSTASVAVLPEIEDVEVEIHDNDLKVEVYRSSGPGGQSVNTTDSAVRITHIPTGIVATSSEKSQLKNKEKALSVLKSRIYAMEMEKRQKELGEARSSQIGTGDRSEKIRTYNFPQDRVTDHRIKKSWSNLPGILDGDIQDIMDSLMIEEQAKKMAAFGE